MQAERLETPETEPAEMFRRVLVPISLHKASRRAVQAALELRRMCGAEVCVFHASRGDENDHFLGGLGSSASRSDLLAEANASVRKFVAALAQEQADALEYDATVSDDYVRAIQTKASEWGATLVVLNDEPHHLMRTHSEKLIRDLDVPVLVLRPDAGSKP